MTDSEHSHDQHRHHQTTGHKHSEPTDHPAHDEHAGHRMPDHAQHAHATHTSPVMPEKQSHSEGMAADKSHAEHAHHVDHSGHEQMFRRRFWGSLLLSIPVLLFSSMIQEWLGLNIPSFPGSQWIPFVFSLVIFAYGGIRYFQMAVPEIRKREPGMMTLISLAISVAFPYSLAA